MQLMLHLTPVLHPMRSELRSALAIVRERYPGGHDWLDQKFDEVEGGRAQLWMLRLDSYSLGYALVVPKGSVAAKLSTFYLMPGARKRGLGQLFLSSLKRKWQQNGLCQVHVTVDENDYGTSSFFKSQNFELLPDGRRSYGERFDQTFVWSPEREDAYFPS